MWWRQRLLKYCVFEKKKRPAFGVVDRNADALGPARGACPHVWQVGGLLGSGRAPAPGTLAPQRADFLGG